MTVNPIILHFEQKPHKVITSAIIRQSQEFCQARGLKSSEMEVRALWDTGAEWCAISREIAHQLQLWKAGLEWVDGFGGSKESEVHYVDITLPDDRHVYNVPAVVYDGLRAQDFVIGMNVITMGDFVLTREDNGTRFTFSME
jgi:hypothetical protein